MSSKKKIIKQGLRKLPEDKRDFKLGALFPKKIKVPDVDFIIGEPTPMNQYDSDLCTAFATCSASELQEKKVLSPEYTFAKTKQLEGSIEEWGADLRTAVKSHVKYGALEKMHSPFSLERKERDFVADWTNWDSVYDASAKIHKKKTFVSVDNDFEGIRQALWIYRNDPKPRAVVTGANWRSSWTLAPNGIISPSNNEDGFGHAFIFIGQKIVDGVAHLVAHLSNGTTIGDKGRFYFPKEVVDKEMTFGNYMFLDLTEREVELLKNGNSFLKKILNWFKDYLKEFN